MGRIALLLILLPACAAGMPVGAATVSGVAAGTSALQRKAGGCYAICAAGTSCNASTGLCERAPCGGSCGRDEHCETGANKSWCAPGAAGDVVSKAPGTPTLPILPPPPPISGGPPQIIPAAESHPPSGR